MYHGPVSQLLPCPLRTRVGLVGDAGYHKDPLTALGISDAFRDANILAEAIGSGLSGREAISQALRSYERRRNLTATPLYEFTLEIDSLAVEKGRRPRGDNQPDTSRFGRMNAGHALYLPE